jgi:hypothetical protein
MNPLRIMRIAERVADDANSLNGMKNAKARKEVMYVLHRNTPRGVLRDSDWRHVDVIWKALNSAAFDWTMVGSQYHEDKEGRSVGKTWKFEVYFKNEKGRDTVIYGVVTASFVDAGGESYDLVAYAT